uniref:uncharacterized protein LOC101304068 n=1 Tax=Fragaria vesca subsp. vesca TaxID=101020 RepID=UPI0005C88466|nr:PREDICTED: uncharacterized protein LOC101304068 [Fragaria vesca subsp. vesca]
MDLDDLDGPSKPARVSRFMPRSKNAPPKPKPEPNVPKFELEPPQLLKPKPEALDGDDSNGTVKMETTEQLKEDDDPMDEEDAEDTVVREIDVFFSPNVDSNTQLYILQYPLRPRWRRYELENRCEEIRVKPDTAQVETLATEWDSCSSTGYVVGVLMGNKLHLNHVHAVVQLQPSLDHLNPGGSKRKGKATGDADVPIKRENFTEEKSLAPSKKHNKHVKSPTEEEEGFTEPTFGGAHPEVAC